MATVAHTPSARTQLLRASEKWTRIAAEEWVAIAAEHLHGPAAPGAAREFIRSQLSPIGDTPALNDVLLATSEIVTNAVQHSSGL
jgi:hypothetical protein